MPEIKVGQAETIALQNGSPTRDACVEMKTADRLLDSYKAVISYQQGSDGKIYQVIVFEKVEIVDGSTLESTY